MLDEFYTDKNDLISELSDLQAHENIQKSRPRRFLRRICFEKFRHEKFPSLARKLQVRGSQLSPESIPSPLHLG